MWQFLLLLLIFFESIADIAAKEWSLHGTLTRAILAIAAYIIANIFWLFALKNGAGLARGSILFSVASAILALIIGLVFYKEPVHKFQLIGLTLGILAIGFLSYE